MPVYNEEACVEQVVRAWFATLDRTVGNFIFLAINDGSTDATEESLTKLTSTLGNRLEILSHSNRGHGQTCIKGYVTALDREIPYLLQIDSDGQSDPVHFPEFWKLRDQFDVIYGKRARKDGLRRVIASRILRLALKHYAKVDCIDANVPYRLMNGPACAEAIRSIPKTFDLANVALAVELRKRPNVRHGEVPIGFPPRLGGEPSVPFLKFAVKARALLNQLNASGLATGRRNENP